MYVVYLHAYPSFLFSPSQCYKYPCARSVLPEHRTLKLREDIVKLEME